MKNTLLLIFVSLFILLSLSTSLYAQEVIRTIKGKITDTDNRPIDGAEVILREIFTGAETNANGNFEIVCLQPIPQNSKLYVYSQSFTSQNISISDTTTYLDITMNKNPNFFTTGSDPNSGYEVIDIDTTINFILSEEYCADPEKPSHFYILDLMTTRCYPNSNYSVKTQIDTSDGKININIDGIIVPEVQLPAGGPARQRFIITNIKKGTTDLIFTYKNIRDEYKISNDSETIKIRKIKRTFTSSANPLYYKYPLNSFIYYSGTTLDTKWICDDFIDFVSSKIKITEFEFPSEKENPFNIDYIYMNGNLIIGGCYYNPPPRYFTYENEADYDKLPELLKAYKKEVIKYKQGISLGFVNFRKKEYNLPN